jgi:hypothetical protein
VSRVVSRCSGRETVPPVVRRDTPIEAAHFLVLNQVDYRCFSEVYLPAITTMLVWGDFASAREMLEKLIQVQQLVKAAHPDLVY